MFKSLSSASSWAAILATTCLMQAAPAFSQSTADSTTGQAAQTSPTSTPRGASPTTPAEQRASNKAARKANRARKNAELKNLERNGYNPATGDNTYPESVLDAEKKVNGR